MKIGVIADDLTGGNGTGVRLGKQGFHPATIVQGAPIPEKNSFNAFVLDTDSRYSTSAVARDRVLTRMNDLLDWGANVFSKRIDSTFRGNIGTELDTMLGKLGSNSVSVVVPSFPDSGRTMVDGNLFVHGILLQETDVARDPVHPITESHIPTLMRKQTVHDVGFLSFHDYDQDLEQKLEELFFLEKRVVICDAVTNDDITTLAKAMACIKHFTVIAVDPGPLTAAYAYEKRKIAGDQPQVLAAIGSATEMTTKQLQFLLKKTGIEPVYVDPKKLASFTGSWEEEIRRVTEKLKGYGNDPLIILTTQVPGHTLLDLASSAKEEGVTEMQLAKQITNGLAKISHQIISDKALFQIKGCFTSGGDVTASLCALSSANGIELKDEVMPLAAFGKLIGGDFNSLPIVTKGGLVGDETAIYQCVSYLQEKI